MEPVPYKKEGEEHLQAVYHIIPDTIHGGWNVYITTDPQEPQRHFQNKEEAVYYVEKLSLAEGVGFIVEESETPSIGI
jgi:hypothetical protein